MMIYDFDQGPLTRRFAATSPPKEEVKKAPISATPTHLSLGGEVGQRHTEFAYANFGWGEGAFAQPSDIASAETAP